MDSIQVPIREYGRLLKTDEDGFLISEASRNKIQPPWLEAVEAAKVVYLRNFGQRLHSVYVRGSVARGLAVLKISDVDTFAIISNEDDFDPTWMSQAQLQLNHQFLFAAWVEVTADLLDDIFDESQIRLRFRIKVESTCVYGSNLSPQIPPFRVNKRLARALQPNIEWILNHEYINEIETSTQAELLETCNGVATELLRTGMVLIMVREGTYTPDLYPSYKCFSKYYPQYEPEMKRLLHLALNPISNLIELKPLVDQFGRWLAKEAETRIHNRS